MTMAERRKYPRLVLGIEDGYFGNFQLENNEQLVGPIVNISAGGLNLAAPEKTADGLKAGDRLLLISIAGGTNFAFIDRISAEIRWIEKSGTPDYCSIGMEFLDITPSAREQMVKFVDSERVARGQYD